MSQVPLFVSYSQLDKTWMKRIYKHLAPLETDGLISRWIDEKLRAGATEGWEEILLGKLGEARVVVVLLSSNFAASDYCQKTELPIILDRQRKGLCKVYFILVKPYSLEEGIKKFLVKPTDQRALSEGGTADRDLTRIANEMREDLKTLPALMEESERQIDLMGEAERLAAEIETEDKVWRREARLLRTFADDVGETRHEILGKFARSGKAELAGERVTALLLRMAALAGAETGKRMEAAIRQSAVLKEHLREAANSADALASTEEACYVVHTTTERDGAILPTQVDYHPKQGAPAVRVSVPADARSLQDAVDAIVTHNDDRIDEPKIHLLVSGWTILNPTDEIGEIDEFSTLHVVFQPRDQIQRRATSATRRKAFADRLASIRGSAAGEEKTVWVRWFGAKDAAQMHCSVPLPAFHPGEGEAGEDRLNAILDAGIPFALVIRKAKHVSAAKKRLPQILSHETVKKQFARVPAMLKGKRTHNEKCPLTHLSVIWDDVEVEVELLKDMKDKRDQ